MGIPFKLCIITPIEVNPPSNEKSSCTKLPIMASSWRSLPPEIRLLILECIIPRYGLEETTTDRGFPPASLLATVCKEWQNFFERRTFRRMDLRATDLQAFSKTVLGENAIRLNYMSSVSLTIKLATFTRLTVDGPERALVVNQ